MTVPSRLEGITFKTMTQNSNSAMPFHCPPFPGPPLQTACCHAISYSTPGRPG